MPGRRDQASCWSLDAYRRLCGPDRVRPVSSVFMRFLFRLLYLSRRELVYRDFHPVAGSVGASRVTV